MDAVIALCHFCETHGPRAIFCTQSLRATRLEDLQLHLQAKAPRETCIACCPLGWTNGFYSEDHGSDVLLVSAQTVASPEVTELVEQASVRSFSAEVDINDHTGGVVFFGDSMRGYVLSHTFRIKDLQARGSYQLYSIVILMKDKYFLPNAKPFLAENMKRISLDLQTSAQKTAKYEETRQLNESTSWQRHKLQEHTRTTIITCLRPLHVVTGNDTVYVNLHSQFTWLLLSGARYLSEHMTTFGHLAWVIPRGNRHHNHLPLPKTCACKLNDTSERTSLSLRHVKQLTGNHFVAICYCVLTGTRVLISDKTTQRSLDIITCLRKLLPDQMQHLVHFRHSQCIDMAVTSSNAYSVFSSSLYIHLTGVNANDISVTWTGQLPSKLPQLLTSVTKAIDNIHINELVLNKRTEMLVEEWKNKVICLGRMKSANGLPLLQRALGVLAQDQPLIKYWTQHL